MKYIDEYRDKSIVLDLVEKINAISEKEIALMKACGGHTMSIQKFEIPYLSYRAGYFRTDTCLQNQKSY